MTSSVTVKQSTRIVNPARQYAEKHWPDAVTNFEIYEPYYTADYERSLGKHDACDHQHMGRAGGPG